MYRQYGEFGIADLKLIVQLSSQILVILSKDIYPKI